MKKLLLLLTAALVITIASFAQTAQPQTLFNYAKTGDTLVGAATGYITIPRMGNGLTSFTATTSKVASTVSAVVYLQATDDPSLTNGWSIITDSLTVGNTLTTTFKTWKFSKSANTDLKQAHIRAVYVLATGTVVPSIQYTRRE